MDMLQTCYGNDGIYNLIYIDDGGLPDPWIGDGNHGNLSINEGSINDTCTGLLPSMPIICCFAKVGTTQPTYIADKAGGMWLSAQATWSNMNQNEVTKLGSRNLGSIHAVQYDDNPCNNVGPDHSSIKVMEIKQKKPPTEIVIRVSVKPWSQLEWFVEWLLSPIIYE